MNIIFGGNGFVGSNLNLDGIKPPVLHCDLLDYQSTINFLSHYKDQQLNIINLAAVVAGFIYNKDHQLEMLYKNSIMVLNLAKAIENLKLNCYYLYVSSVCAYQSGNSTENQVFNGEPDINNYGYGMAKRFGIAVSKALSLNNPNVKTCVLIPSNMYGSFDKLDLNKGHVIPSLFVKMLRGDSKIEVLGNCNNIRGFLFVEDLCRLIKEFVENEQEGIYNVISPEQITIKGLTLKIKKIIGYKGELVFNESGKLEKRQNSGKKLEKLYPSFKFTSLDDGLQKTFNWISQQII